MPKTGRSRRWSPWLVVVGFVGTGSVVAALGSQWGAFMRALSWLGRLSLGWLGVAVVVEIVSFVLAAELQHRLLGAAHIRLHRSALIALAYASTAVSAVFPMGTALSARYSYRVLTRRDASPGVATWVLAASGVVSAAMLVLLALVGAELRGFELLSSVAGVALATIVVAAAVAAVACTAWVSGHEAALDAITRRITAVTQRGQLLLHRRSLRATTEPDESVPTPGRPVRLDAWGWLGVAGLATANWMADCIVLALAFVSLGLPVPWSGLLLAYVVPQLVGALPVSVLGLAEGSLSVALVCAGVRADHAIAAVLIYQLVGLWTTLPTGGLACVYLRKRKPSARLLVPLAPCRVRPCGALDTRIDHEAGRTPGASVARFVRKHASVSNGEQLNRAHASMRRLGSL